jgi:hypothetical protein
MQTVPSYRNPSIFAAAKQQPAIQQLCFRGEVRDAVSRYGLQLNWEGSQGDQQPQLAKISGRCGGWWLGERLQLEWNGQELLGVVWSGQVRYAVSARFLASSDHADAGTLELRLVGASERYRANLHLTGTQATGTATSVEGTFSLDFDFTAGVLTGSSNSQPAQAHQRQYLHLQQTTPATGQAPLAVLVALATLADALNREVALESLRLMGEA